MGNRFSSGKNSISQCDRCNFRFRLHELKTEIIKTKPYQIKVCNACWDPDHPQLQLGMYPVDDPQGVRDPRPDITYLLGGNTGLQITNTPGTGTDAAGTPSGGSRVIQWGWNPVGGSRLFTALETPNNLVSNVQLGTVQVLLEQAPGAFLTGVSSAGEVGNALGPLPITGVETTGSVGSVAVPLYLSGVSASFTQGTPNQSVAVSIAVPGATVRYIGSGNWIVRIFWNSVPNQALVQQLSDQLANCANGQVWMYSDAVYGVPFGVIPTNPGPEICFGRFYQVNYFPSFGFADFYVESGSLPSPYPQLGDWGVYSYVRTETRFSVPNPGNALYYPVYVNNGATCSLTWTGDTAKTLNSTYQNSVSIVGAWAQCIWNTGGNIYMGVVTGVTYVGGEFKITMDTNTAVNPTGNYPISVITFPPKNPAVAYITSGVESTTAVASVGKNLTTAVSCPGQSITFASSPPSGYQFNVPLLTTLGGWIFNNINGQSYSSTYMFADIGGGSYVGLGYLGQFNQAPGSIMVAYIGLPLPSNFPGLGTYTINNFVLGYEFGINGTISNQYATYSEAGGVATFTWTGEAALRMRDTYATSPVLPAGTEIDAAIYLYSGFNWFAQRLYLGTLLSMGYSSGTFTMTYTVANSFVPYPGGTPSAGMMYFDTGGITFLPMVLNV